jgi:hypothetical protein
LRKAASGPVHHHHHHHGYMSTGHRETRFPEEELVNPPSAIVASTAGTGSAQTARHGAVSLSQSRGRLAHERFPNRAV